MSKKPTSAKELVEKIYNKILDDFCNLAYIDDTEGIDEKIFARILANITALIDSHVAEKDDEIERLEIELIDAHLKTKDIEVIQKDNRIAELENDIYSLLHEAGGDWKNYCALQRKYKALKEADQALKGE